MTDIYGVISTQLDANAIGNSSNCNATVINRSGAQVQGSLSFAGGNDNRTLEAGSLITGSFDGGGTSLRCYSGGSVRQAGACRHEKGRYDAGSGRRGRLAQR